MPSGRSCWLGWQDLGDRAINAFLTVADCRRRRTVHPLRTVAIFTSIWQLGLQAQFISEVLTLDSGQVTCYEKWADVLASKLKVHLLSDRSENLECR